MNSKHPASPGGDASKLEITACLERWRLGDDLAIHQIYDLIYVELKRNAASVLARFNPQNAQAMTYSPTDLLHEVSARILNSAPSRKWNHRKEFYALVTKAMLNLLIGNHTKKQALKHGREYRKITFAGQEPGGLGQAAQDHPDVMTVDQALQALALVDPIRSQILQLHFFEGYTIEEIAKQLGLAKSTVSTKKTIALGWLRTYIEKRSIEAAQL